MITRITQIPKEKFWDYFIMIGRFLIGWTFLRYGYSKMVDGQFGITDAELGMQVKDLSLFKLSWYLFDHQPFKAFIGVSQLICGTLLIINRTAIIGALMFLPIIATVLIIDLSFMPPGLANGFAWRLSFYIILDFLILWHYKERMLAIWNLMWDGMGTKFKFPIWAYLILPVLAIGLEIVGVILKLITNLIINPSETIEVLSHLLERITE